MPALFPAAYERLLRPLLFKLPPETAQKAAEFMLRRRWAWRSLASGLRVKNGKLFVNLCGITLENPVGLAAGYDKNCELLPSLAAMGFSYLTGGTVTEKPRQGNPKPRLLRYADERSLVNALGFPNKGLEAAAHHLELARESLGSTLLVVSISGTTADEIIRCHQRLEPLVDTIEINISSPNTEGLRALQEAPALGALLGRVNEDRSKPMMVKLSPYPHPLPTSPESSDDEARDRVLALARVCLDHGVDALTVANSRPTNDSELSTGAGGLSGKAVYPGMLRMVADIRAEVGDRAAINACGGVFSGQDAWQALKAGATTVQLYTGLVYRGPSIIRDINQELLDIMAREELDSLITLPSDP